MDQTEKDAFLADARAHLGRARSHIEESLASARQDMSDRLAGIRASDNESEEAAMYEQAALAHLQRRVREMEKLYPSPYFQRLDLRFPGQESDTPFFLGKFPFEEENVISWFAPLAAIRFEEPGETSYLTAEGETQHVSVSRKDQFMIADGNIIFLATESLGQARELVYQDYFNSRQKGFQLPEIVAQMEKAQDQVIRAHHIGPFRISGPAGSGKTTLALHRVAYLTQSPDTEQLYPAPSILVLVQDEGTRDYFSHLLPELGINNVRIQTFASWALSLLRLEGYRYENRIGGSEPQRDRYEYRKIRSMRAATLGRMTASYPFLERIYDIHSDDRALFAYQKENRVLDAIDLTLLMEARQATRDGFQSVTVQRVRQKNGLMADKKTVSPLRYSLVLVDEFQNYLPEQLAMFERFLAPKTRSMLHVGDLAQQTRFGAEHDASAFASSDRSVRLHKVYRNTRHILAYAREAGFAVEIPEGLKEGRPVTEIIAPEFEDELARVREICLAHPGQVGILGFDPDHVERYERAFAHEPRIHCLSVREAQGVEFETVCLTGISDETFRLAPDEEADAEFATAKRRIMRDLLYVALTRAISDLYVLGTVSLTNRPE